MKKITRTIERKFTEITIYDENTESLVTTTDCCYEMSDKEAFKYFEKKYSSTGKVVKVVFKEVDNLKVSMDVETFVSLATVTPAVSETPEMPEPIVNKE